MVNHKLVERYTKLLKSAKQRLWNAKASHNATEIDNACDEVDQIERRLAEAYKG